jgi:4-amino-4-deoxy-L-arabinose transferase-like glycosyltransferase
MIATALVRGAVLLAMGESLSQDPDAYRRLAHDLVETGVYGLADPETGLAQPSAFRPPLYPLLLAVFSFTGPVSSLAVGVLHWLLGLATVGMVYVLGQRFKLGSGAVVAAALVAFDPILLNQSTEVMTETLATFLATLAMLALTRIDQDAAPRAAGFAGIVLGIAVLCRPTFLPWLAVVVAVLLLGSWRVVDGSEVNGGVRKGQKWARSAAFVLGAAVILAPWAGRNYMVLGVPKVSTTHGGYTLLLGNNPGFYRYLDSPRFETWNAILLAQAWQNRGRTTGPGDPAWDVLEEVPHLSKRGTGPPIATTELADDSFAYALATRYISGSPTLFARACLYRIRRFWGWVPERRTPGETSGSRWLRWGIGGWYLLVTLAAVGGVLRLRARLMSPPWLWGMLLCLVFTAVHIIFWSNMRMRAPCLPFACLLATAGPVAWRRRQQGVLSD